MQIPNAIEIRMLRPEWSEPNEGRISTKITNQPPPSSKRSGDRRTVQVRRTTNRARKANQTGRKIPKKCGGSLRFEDLVIGICSHSLAPEFDCFEYANSPMQRSWPMA